jgi:hypothetical protein
MKNTIYVQIASYRDPELRNTVRSLLETAKFPENLHIGIAWQHSPYEEWDHLNEYIHDSRFRIIDIDYRDAKGPCYARYLLNNQYKNETYTLQLDSHHRFVQDWDVILIDMLKSVKSPTCKKPLLSSYLPSYNPANDPADRLEAPWIMEFDRFAPEGPVHFLPHTIDDYKERNNPVPARFISGHFIFTYGKFCNDVQYDPTYYFHGEEINLSVRAYMAGYDLFAPHRTVMWHEYTRDGKKKHWDDHANWPQLDRQSHAHNRQLLGIDQLHSDKRLTSNVRTLQEYEQYAGLEFATRRVHTNTIQKKLPPVSLDEFSHMNGLQKFHRMCIDIYRPTFAENDYTFWAVAFEDANGNEIYREDATPAEISRLLSVPLEQDKFIHIWRNFYVDILPSKWVVWPYSASKGWGERLTGQFSVG